MTAVAHQLVDEPIDPAEAPMSAADFQVIERAHQLCDDPPARELSAEVTKAPGSLHHAAICRRLCDELNEGALLRDIGDETNWQQVAADAWRSEGWAQAAQEYRAKRVRQ